MQFLVWLEHSGFATTVKESAVLYEIPLVLHAIGMAALVGLSTAVYLRILGFGSSLPLAPMEQFFPIMYAGFWINALSGVVLFSLYPIKAVTNPGFFIKMTGVVLAVVCLRRIKRQVFGNPAVLDTRPVPTRDKILAGTSLFVWLATITAGRLMAYHGIAGVEWATAFAVLVVTVMLVLAGFAADRILGMSSPSHVNASVSGVRS
jgi:dipeptide/tripeptide permease